MSWTQGNGERKAVLALVGSGLGAFVLALALSIHSSRGQSFDNSFRQNCRTEALKNCFSDQVVAKYCDCTLAKFKESKSMDKAVVRCLAALP